MRKIAQLIFRVRVMSNKFNYVALSSIVPNWLRIKKINMIYNLFFAFVSAQFLYSLFIYYSKYDYTLILNIFSVIDI